MEKAKKSVRLYDAGGVFLLLALFGIPFGSILDYIWNFVVFGVTLRFLPGGNEKPIGHWKKLAFCFFVTLLGVVIDWAYLELAWDTDFGKYALWLPAVPLGLQLVGLLLPMAMIALVNFALAYAFLSMERKQAAIIGGAMGVFTTPWLLVAAPYLLGWTV